MWICLSWDGELKFSWVWWVSLNGDGGVRIWTEEKDIIGGVLHLEGRERLNLDGREREMLGWSDSTQLNYPLFVCMEIVMDSLSNYPNDPTRKI